jgi:hypothetical protein
VTASVTLSYTSSTSLPLAIDHATPNGEKEVLTVGRRKKPGRLSFKVFYA